MEGVGGLILWVAIMVIGLVSSALKAKKKREEDARRAADAARRAAETRSSAEVRGSAEFGDAAGRDAAYRSVGDGSAGTGSRDGFGTGSGAGMGGEAKSTGGTFGRMLEELSRQLGEQPSPPVVTRPLSKPLTSRPASTTRPSMSASSTPRPMASSQPTATSYDYRSLEEDYSGVEGGYGLEDPDAERYYAGGEGRAESGTTTHRPASGKHGRSAALKTAAKGKSAISAPEAGNVDANGLTEGTHLRDILGGDFDLRRAIIEAEILTPKYITHG